MLEISTASYCSTCILLTSVTASKWFLKIERLKDGRKCVISVWMTCHLYQVEPKPDCEKQSHDFVSMSFFFVLNGPWCFSGSKWSPLFMKTIHDRTLNRCATEVIHFLPDDDLNYFKSWKLLFCPVCNRNQVLTVKREPQMILLVFQSKTKTLLRWTDSQWDV